MPSPFPRRTTTLFVTSLAAAKSSLLSLLKSPTTTWNGRWSLNPPKTTSAGDGEVNVPLPTPRRIETLLLSILTEARSSLPSPLKSPTAMEIGLSATPTNAGLGEVNVPLPTPKRIDNTALPWSAEAKSCLPSPLKSPTATAAGLAPTETSGGAGEVNPDVPPHTVPLLTVSTNVFVSGKPKPKALTVTVYVPAGCASVTRTTPVAGFAANVPLKLVFVEASMLVAFDGVADGVMVPFALNASDVFE